MEPVPEAGAATAVGTWRAPPCSRAFRSARLIHGDTSRTAQEKAFAAAAGAEALRRAWRLQAGVAAPSPQTPAGTCSAPGPSGPGPLTPPPRPLCPQCSFYEDLSPRRALCRTLSDESVCSHRRGASAFGSRSSALDQVLPGDTLFSSTPPGHGSLPPRPLAPGPGGLRGEWGARAGAAGACLSKQTLRGGLLLLGLFMVKAPRVDIFCKVSNTANFEENWKTHVKYIFVKENSDLCAGSQLLPRTEESVRPEVRAAPRPGAGGQGGARRCPPVSSPGPRARWRWAQARGALLPGTAFSGSRSLHFTSRRACRCFREVIP